MKGPPDASTQVNQDFQVETVHQVVLVLKERGETWASRDRQDPVFHRSS